MRLKLWRSCTDITQFEQGCHPLILISVLLPQIFCLLCIANVYIGSMQGSYRTCLGFGQLWKERQFFTDHQRSLRSRACLLLATQSLKIRRTSSLPVFPVFSRFILSDITTVTLFPSVNVFTAQVSFSSQLWVSQDKGRLNFCIVFWPDVQL